MEKYNNVYDKPESSTASATPSSYHKSIVRFRDELVITYLENGKIELKCRNGIIFLDAKDVHFIISTAYQLRDHEEERRRENQNYLKLQHEELGKRLEETE